MAQAGPSSASNCCPPLPALPYIFAQLQQTRPAPGRQYRDSILGLTLQESLMELINSGKISEQLGRCVMAHFDVHVAAHLSRCGVQAKFMSDGLHTYKEVSGRYDFVLNNVEIAARGRGAFHVNAEKIRVKAQPSAKLQKKIALKKGRKGAGAYAGLEKENVADTEDDFEDE